jgi:hypothetical protein
MKEASMREIYHVKNKGYGTTSKDGGVDILAGFLISIDWDDPDAKILSGFFTDGPWQDNEITTKDYEKMRAAQPFYAEQIDEQRAAKAKRPKKKR